MSDKVINIYQTEDSIMVRINKWALAEVAEKHPTEPYKVLELQKWINMVVWQMENYAESNERELGISYLENAMDKFMQEVAIDHSELVETIEWWKNEK